MLEPGGSGRDWLARILIPLLFFCATAPTLRWVEFAGGAENIVVATALEMRRSGEWVVPTLAGQKRLAKPPLAAWVAAISIDRQTFERTRDDSSADLESAYKRLTWEVRWPALLCGCIALAFTYDLARNLAGRRLAVIAALAHGASYGFLRYSRIASTDVQLALWVTAGNFFLARAIVQNKRWSGCLGAGVAIALAFISKGPVSLLQTLLPFVVFGSCARASTPPQERQRGIWLPAIGGTILFAALALPWFIYVASRTQAWSTWYVEVLRQDPTVPKGSALNYLTIFALVLPWSAFFIAGVLIAIEKIRLRPLPPITAALFLVVIPILVMVFFPDRKERYLLPMLSPAAILVAEGVMALRESVLAKRMVPVVAGHWLILIAVGILLPIAAALPKLSGMKTSEGGPWLSWPLAIAASAVCGVLIILGVSLGRARTGPLVAVTVAIILLIQPLLMWGYSKSDDGQSDVKNFAFALRRRFPGVPAYSYRPGRRAPEDLSIYMNRTVHMLNSLKSVPPSNRPQLLLVFDHRSFPAPSVGVAWSWVDSQKRGEGTWNVYYKP